MVKEIEAIVARGDWTLTSVSIVPGWALGVTSTHFDWMALGFAAAC